MKNKCLWFNVKKNCIALFTGSNHQYRNHESQILNCEEFFSISLTFSNISADFKLCNLLYWKILKAKQSKSQLLPKSAWNQSDKKTQKKGISSLKKTNEFCPFGLVVKFYKASGTTLLICGKSYCFWQNPISNWIRLYCLIRYRWLHQTVFINNEYFYVVINNYHLLTTYLSINWEA